MWLWSWFNPLWSLPSLWLSCVLFSISVVTLSLLAVVVSYFCNYCAAIFTAFLCDHVIFCVRFGQFVFLYARFASVLLIFCLLSCCHHSVVQRGSFLSFYGHSMSFFTHFVFHCGCSASLHDDFASVLFHLHLFVVVFCSFAVVLHLSLVFFMGLLCLLLILCLELSSVTFKLSLHTEAALQGPSDLNPRLKWTLSHSWFTVNHLLSF